MLSADVPEFVPRAYQNLDSLCNTPTAKPEERTPQPQPQQTHSPSESYKPPPSSRFGLTRAPEGSWRERREPESDPSHNSPKQNYAWRQPAKESGRWRGRTHTHEVGRHEKGTETLQETHSSPPKLPEKQILPKGRGRARPMTAEDLEAEMRNKFVALSMNTTHSYTRVLKSNPKNSTPEARPTKQDFSLSIESQWPTLGGAQFQNTSNQSSRSVETGNATNPWVSKSSEVSPAKSPTKNPQNCREERRAPESTKSTAVRPKSTKNHHKPSEDAVKTKQDSVKPQRKAEIKESLSDSRRLESTSRHTPTNPSGVEPKIQSSNATSALSSEDDNSSGISKHEETDNVTKDSNRGEDSDSFQWKVIGEKKKKPKIKEEKVQGSPRLQELRGNGKTYARKLPDRPSPNFERKRTQEYSGKAAKDSMFNKLNDRNVHSTSGHVKLGEKKDSPTQKPYQKEGKKSRPTKVASLANCRSDKREIRSTVSKSVALGAAKPLDEEALQRKLAAKRLKQDEKRKKRERKAQEALIKNRPKDTKVSFITTDFLEKTQTCNKKTYDQMPEQPMSHLSSSVHEGVMPFTSEEYPALQMQRSTTPSSPLKRITQPKTRNWMDKSNKEMPSTRVNVQGNNLVPRHNKGVPRSPEKGATASGEHATTYRTALLAAKEKEACLTPVHDSAGAGVIDCDPFETLQKKKVRTTDRIELDLLTLAAYTGKKKKKDLLEVEYSPTKTVDEEDEQDQPSMSGLAAQALLYKGAVVVAKRGKISTKPKKKKVSRIKKCQMEKRQRDMLALQLLLQQAKLRSAQQSSLETPPTTHIEAEESSKEGDSGENSKLEQSCSSTLMTEENQEMDDDKKRLSTTLEIKERETEDEENKENTRTSEMPFSTHNTNAQISNKTPNDSNGKKPKIVWVLSKTENSVAQSPVQSSGSGVKAESEGEGKQSDQQLTEEGSPASPVSPSHKELMSDPLVVERASELISFVKAQSHTQESQREYIHQVVTPEVNAVAKELMKSLINFQARHYQREPIKARIKRRYVCGLKETTKLMGKMSCVIMAPNIERCEGPGSLDDAVEKLLNQAEKHKVPVVFALSMRMMKRLCLKQGKRVSCFGIISYQGAQDLFKRLMELLPEAQKQYQQLVACGQCSLPKEGEEEEEEEEGELDKEVNQKTKNDLTEEIIARTNALLKAP